MVNSIILFKDSAVKALCIQVSSTDVTHVMLIVSLLSLIAIVIYTAFDMLRYKYKR